MSLGDMFVIGVNAIDLAGSTIEWDGGATDIISGLYKAGLAIKLADDKFVLADDGDFDGTALGNTLVLSAEFSLGGLLGEDEPVEEAGAE